MPTSDNAMADTGEKIFIGKGEERRLADARACQPPWPRHRRYRNWKNGLAASDGGRICARRRRRVSPPTSRETFPASPQVGEPKDFIVKRAGEVGLSFQPDQFSTIFWDVFGEQGHPVARPQQLQEGVLNVAFRVADDDGLALIDMKDLRARARSPTRSSAGSWPISASRSAARSAVRSAARWCAARSAACCGDDVSCRAAA